MPAKRNQAFIFLVLCLIIPINSYSQRIATLEVELAKPAYQLDIPVNVNLDKITYESDTILALYEITGQRRDGIPFQIEPGEIRKLHWVISSGKGSGEKHIYELVREQKIQPEIVKASVSNGTLTIQKGRQNLLQYYFTIQFVHFVC